MTINEYKALKGTLERGSYVVVKYFEGSTPTTGLYVGDNLYHFSEGYKGEKFDKAVLCLRFTSEGVTQNIPLEEIESVEPMG